MTKTQANYAGDNAWWKCRQAGTRQSGAVMEWTASSPKVQGAVVVFLSLAARYFDCMCSTPKVWRFDRLTGGSGEVGAGRTLRQSSSEVWRETTSQGGTEGGRDLSAPAGGG